MTPEQAVARIGRDLATTALFVDFDGVLAPIVPDPAAARAVEGAGPALEALVGRCRQVAAVSGRPVSFLETHLPPALDLVGLYGLERRIAGHRTDDPRIDGWPEVIAGVVVDAADGPAGMHTESKGLSITLHYRSSPEAGPEVVAWADEVAARTGLHARPAKMSVELHPPIETDKGTVVHDLGAGAATVVYAGDDLGDVPAFDGLDRLADEGADVVRIAVGRGELPPELAERADLVLPDPDAFVGMLRAIAGAP